MELNIFFYLRVCKQAYLEKHTFFKQHSCWKSIHHVSWLRNYCTARTTVLENIVVRSWKKHSRNKVSYKYLGSPIQADPNTRRSQYSHVFFILLTVFTRKSAYARKSASLELAPPFWRKIFNERLPRMSAPLFSQKGRSLEK